MDPILRPVGDYFKSQTGKSRALFLHPLAFMLLGEMIQWCVDNNLSCVITDTVSTISEDTYLKRVSSTHRDGRAFDISSKGWSDDNIKTFMDYFSTKYSKIAAVNSDNEPVLIVYHNAGTGYHLHVQINKRFTVTPTVT